MPYSAVLLKIWSDRMRILFSFCLVFMIFSCKKAERIEVKKITPEFSITINENDDGHLFIVQTNLPDTTELLVTIYDENEIVILAQDENSVINGISSFGPFRNRNDRLSGKFIFEITMPVMFVQNEKVRKILGENGENIESPFIFEEFDSVGLEQKFNIEL
jgi:hypothetical protein